MNKSELINAMAEKAGLTKVQAKNALDAFMGATGETLKGHNPRTNKAITIPAKKVVKFKPGAGLKF